MGPQKSSKSWDITNHNYSIETHFLNIPISRNPMRRRAKWPSSCARRCRSGHRDAGTRSRRAPHAPPPWNMKRTERGVVEIIFTTTMEFCPTWIGTYASKLRFSELYKVYKVYKVYIYIYVYIYSLHPFTVELHPHVTLATWRGLTSWHGTRARFTEMSTGKPWETTRQGSAQADPAPFL